MVETVTKPDFSMVSEPKPCVLTLTSLSDGLDLRVKQVNFLPLVDFGQNVLSQPQKTNNTRCLSFYMEDKLVRDNRCVTFNPVESYRHLSTLL